MLKSMALDPKELQALLDELSASRASRRNAWAILKELRLVLSEVAGVDLPPPAAKNISILKDESSGTGSAERWRNANPSSKSWLRR